MRIVAFAASFLVMLMTATSQPSANTVYTYSDVQSQFFLFANGTITTDGNIGVLDASDIVAWDITITSPVAIGGLPFTIAGPSNISSVILSGGALSATETNLVWDNSVPNSTLSFVTDDHVLADFKGFILYQSFPGSGTFLIGVLPGVCGTPGFGCNLEPPENRSGLTVVAAPATPLPAALPLFATGLGALVVLGWRRKRPQSRTPQYIPLD